MDPKVTYIFDALDRAGVSITDFSRITSISRESLHRWKTGSAIKDKLRLNLAYSTATRLETACREGILPLHDKLKTMQRVKVLRKIIADMASR